MMKLIIGDKNLSSWSLRPWLALKGAGIKFEEILIALDKPDTDKNVLKYSPSGKVPALLDGDILVYESLAICEYIAECFPEAKLWPKEKEARAMARSVSTEMHAGFQDLRMQMPMHCAEKIKGVTPTQNVKEDIERITAIWSHCRKKFGAQGKMLFGDFTIADAMFAPVVTRFNTYGVEINDSAARDYMGAVLNLPSMGEWVMGAQSELM